jgi:hypothetical protein
LKRPLASTRHGGLKNPVFDLGELPFSRTHE